MITEFISAWAIRCLEVASYPGAAGLMALESMIFPVPSEAVMPFVGFLVADGKWSLSLAILSTSLGSLAGSSASYLMGYYGGRPLILKVGKYLLLNVHDLERTEAFFQRRRGTITLFVSRFIPVVRHFISIPAGIGRMPFLAFLPATLVGATLWNTFLLFCGIKLREHWNIVQKYSHQIDYAVAAFIMVAIAWFIWQRRKHYLSSKGLSADKAHS
jgi:membrane protein DedA with SNARE-associated domain